MKRSTSKKSAPLAKKRASSHRKVKTNKTGAKQQRAQMTDYLLEAHPELLENCHLAWNS